MARHPTLYLHTGRRFRVTANRLVPKSALYKQRSPNHRSRYSQSALPKHTYEQKVLHLQGGGLILWLRLLPRNEKKTQTFDKLRRKVYIKERIRGSAGSTDTVHEHATTKGNKCAAQHISHPDLHNGVSNHKMEWEAARSHLCENESRAR